MHVSLHRIKKHNEKDSPDKKKKRSWLFETQIQFKAKSFCIHYQIMSFCMKLKRTVLGLQIQGEFEKKF